MASFQFAMTTFSIITKIGVASYLVNVKHMTRIVIVSLMALGSFSLISLASFHGLLGDKDSSFEWFFVALIACCLMGMCQGLGEATFLGFLKEYPSHTVGYVSSGTGFAGIFGSGTYLAF